MSGLSLNPKSVGCHGCGHPLTGDDPHPQRHQEVVLPPVRAEVIEYQLHTLRCAHCDRLTAAGWPEGVSRHTFGPSVQAWVGLLAGAYRLSKRNIRALLSDAFGLRSGVEPTNNEAERALRHGVLWRHTSFGTHSAEGSRFVERLLTVRDTLRQQQRNVLDYLRMACQAAVSQQPAPSLLPSTHSPIR